MHVGGRRAAARAAVTVAAALALALAAAGTAGATTFSWSSALSGSDIIASHLPGDPNASGSASITGDDTKNQMCGTFGWSNVSPAPAFAHIHEGQYGVPENPGVTIQFFADLPAAPSNPTSGCATVPNALIDEIAQYPYMFNVVLHNQTYPGGVVRGQLAPGDLSWVGQKACSLPQTRGLCQINP